MHWILVWGTPLSDFGFGLGLATCIYIYNPHPFPFSKKIYKLQKNQKPMFQNICGAAASEDGDSHVMASGFNVSNSHYVIVIQSMSGEVLELSVTELDDPIF